MIETPKIVQTTAHQAAIIHLTIPRSEMMTTNWRTELNRPLKN